MKRFNSMFKQVFGLEWETIKGDKAFFYLFMGALVTILVMVSILIGFILGLE